MLLCDSRIAGIHLEMCVLLVEGQILRDDIDYDADVADLALEVSLLLLSMLIVMVVVLVVLVISIAVILISR